MKRIRPFTFRVLRKRACSSTGNTQQGGPSLLNPKAVNTIAMTVANDGISANYNGMLTSIEHRFARNYTVLANYTCRSAWASLR